MYQQNTRGLFGWLLRLGAILFLVGFSAILAFKGLSAPQGEWYTWAVFIFAVLLWWT